MGTYLRNDFKKNYIYTIATIDGVSIFGRSATNSINFKYYYLKLSISVVILYCFKVFSTVISCNAGLVTSYLYAYICFTVEFPVHLAPYINNSPLLDFLIPPICPLKISVIISYH